MPGAKETPKRDKRTVAELREESRRRREEARSATDPVLKRTLARHALELAQLAEQGEREAMPAAPRRKK